MKVMDRPLRGKGTTCYRDRWWRTYCNLAKKDCLFLIFNKKICLKKIIISLQIKDPQDKAEDVDQEEEKEEEKEAEAQQDLVYGK
jgi:hypothetical protein